MMDDVVVSRSRELFLLGAKTSASADRLPGINFCSSLQTQHLIDFTQSLLLLSTKCLAVRLSGR